MKPIPLIGCIPVKEHPEHPKDQSPCTQEICLFCNQLMWVSEKKKALRFEKGYPIYCIPCILMRTQDIDVWDLTKGQV